MSQNTIIAIPNAAGNIVLVAATPGPAGVSAVLSYTQDCSAGGTIAYAGPSFVPSMVILTGTPASPFSYTISAANLSTLIVNQTSRLVTVNGSVAITGGASMPVYTTTSGMLLPGFGDGGHGDIATGFDTGSGDYQGTFLYVQTLGITNKINSGAQSAIPIYGPSLQHQDGATNGITPPAMLGAPGSVGITNGTALAYVAGLGEVFVDVSGENGVIAPVVQYQFADWSTQRMSRGIVGPDAGDTLIGPGSTNTYGMGLPAVGTTNLNQTTHVRFVFQARVIETSGTTEAVGDMATVVQEVDYVIVGGVLQTPIAGAQTLTYLDQTSSGTVNVDTWFSPSGTPYTENSIGLVATTPSGYDPSTVVDIAIFAAESFTT